MEDRVIPRHFILAWLVMGLSSMIGQLILMRELLIVFYGNEISIGIILASWLFWVSIGSFFQAKSNIYGITQYSIILGVA